MVPVHLKIKIIWYWYMSFIRIKFKKMEFRNGNWKNFFKTKKYGNKSKLFVSAYTTERIM